MTVSRSSTVSRTFRGAAMWLLIVLGACSGEVETRGEISGPQPEAKRQAVLISFDVSKSPTPESPQAWKCEVGKSIDREFTCGYVAITKVTKDSFATPAQIFEISCPKPVPWGPKGAHACRREAPSSRAKGQSAEIRRWTSFRSRPHRSSGALIRGREDLQSLIEKNPRLGKIMWRIYSDFQAPLNLQQGKQVLKKP
jgi:hypothetical protein